MALTFVDVIAPALENTQKKAIARLEAAKEAHTKNGQRYWSVGQMIKLTQKQIGLIESSIQTVSLLKSSDLYRKENGEEIMRGDRNVTITSNSYNNNSNVESGKASVCVKNDRDGAEKSTAKSWLAKISAGIVIAVVAAVIIKYFGLQ